MKKIINVGLCAVLAIFGIFTQFQPVEAEDYTDSTYWSNYCSSSANSYTEACKGYVQYLTAQSESYRSQLEEIEAQREQIAADLVSYDAELKEYQAQSAALQTSIDAKQVEIDSKQTEIDAKQIEINNKQAEIDTTQGEVDDLQSQVATRMVNSQGTMRLSKVFDVLMGAQSFDEFLLITNGLNAISEFDDKTLEDLAALIALLNTQKSELDVQKADLETAKGELEAQQAELVSQQNDIIVLEQKMQVIIQEAQKQEGILMAQNTTLVANISEIQNTIASIDLDAVPSASGWLSPIVGSYISAGTWDYPGGWGAHLGVDYAVGVGTPIRAVAAGLVIHSSDGCPTYGYLGNMCGQAYGAAGGGNQVSILVKVNGGLYAVSYAHLQLGSTIAMGSTVTAGQQIGLVGASGNTTGPHSHVAVHYLGDASNFSTYATTWNGDLSFGCGWQGIGYDGYGRRCDHGYGAPCRIRPETIFGG